MLLLLLGFVAAYIIGSIPTAYLLVKLVKGVDVRTVGSGNVGATNAGRVLGGSGFFAVMILDAIKGFLPTFLYIRLLIKYDLSINYSLLFALIIISGHTFSIFLKFKGGKGIATSLGVFIALAPVPIIFTTGIFLIILGITSTISASSLCAAIALGISVVYSTQWHGLWVFTWCIVTLIIVLHRANIKRILRGTESKINLTKKLKVNN